MSGSTRQEHANFIYENLRLRTQPIAVKFLENAEFPDKTRRPSQVLGKRITICQGVTMARVYGWPVGLGREDLICVPAMIAFGFTPASDQKSVMRKLLCNVTLSKDMDTAKIESDSMFTLAKNPDKGIYLAPLTRTALEPDTIVIYGNPAQMMRLIQAWVYMKGSRITGNFGGKIECTEYLIGPYKENEARIAIPGNGDRIFSMTQDDEMAFTLPGGGLETLVEGLKNAGKALGARYPITFYQNFQPEFPKHYKELGSELGV
ncbi:MAG: DUF169 domain-containing protein [Deltaproteobacteria bacterium]|nr:DUF169 domain-containing protein [Deltaproteobacteria bacterium]